MTGRRPRFRIEANGRPFPPEGARIKSVTVTDREGTRSDSLEIVLDDGPTRRDGVDRSGFLAIPETRATLRVWGGYDEALLYFGSYSDADVSIACLPYAMTIKATAADVKSGLKSPIDRHWDGATVSRILGDLARDHGLTPSIDPDLGAVTLGGGYFAVTGESVLGVGRRLADRVGGVFAVKDGRLLLLKRGASLSATGRPLPGLTLTPSMIQPGSCTIEISGRAAAGAVEAETHDRDRAARETVTADATDGAAGARRLPYPLGDRADARRAAEAEAARARSEAERLTVTIEGDPAVRAGLPLTLSGVRPGVDGRRFIIESATHRYSAAGGYTTAISAKAAAEPAPAPQEPAGGQSLTGLDPQDFAVA